jgi:hypothetical protein
MTMAETALQELGERSEENTWFNNFTKFIQIKKCFIELPVICYYFSDISAAQ